MILRQACPRILFASLVSMGLMSCGSPARQEQSSQPLVTDVDHTIAKRQSIGNCWLYATSTWLESLALTQGETLDVSESYWTWWHFYNQIVGRSSIKEISTGGSWYTSSNILLAHGFVQEGDFLPSEAGTEMSLIQLRAVSVLNEALKPEGRLGTKELRTAANVRLILDEAFGSNMAAAEAIARTAIGVNNKNLKLSTLLSSNSRSSWRQVSFPQLYGEGAVASPRTVEQRRAIWKRVMRALNDRKPVVMSFQVDFNALDNNDGTFKGALLTKDNLGSEGGHMVVLEDYTVNNVPDIGHIGRGDVSDELKAKALEGELELLVAKNSWGNNRPSRGIINGLTSFDASYLQDSLPWKEDAESTDTTKVEWYSSLRTFVLPAGY